MNTSRRPKKQKQHDALVTVKLPASLVEELDREAVQELITRSAHIRRILQARRKIPVSH